MLEENEMGQLADPLRAATNKEVNHVSIWPIMRQEIDTGESGGISVPETWMKSCQEKAPK